MIDLKQVIVNSEGEPMKQNFKTVENDSNGKEVETTERRAVTLKDIIKVALLKSSQRDIEKKPNDKSIVARYQAWKKIQYDDHAEFTRQEKKLLKKLINQHYEILVAGQAIELLK